MLYGVLEEADVITRSVVIKNVGTNQVTIEKAAAACLDFVTGTFDVLRFMENMRWNGIWSALLWDMERLHLEAAEELPAISTIRA